MGARANRGSVGSTLSTRFQFSVSRHVLIASGEHGKFSVDDFTYRYGPLLPLECVARPVGWPTLSRYDRELVPCIQMN